MAHQNLEFLHINEWGMGLWLIFRAHQYFRPEISLFAFHRSDMEETKQCGIHDTGIADRDDQTMWDS